MPSFQMHPNHHASPPYSASLVFERTQSQWLFSPAELLRTPSILDGMSPSQESSNRSKGVNFITQVGILLKLPQLTLATASVYLHRFFMRHSMVDLPNRPGLHHYSVAATALFLATKVEENCRKMRELVVACCRVAQKQPNLVVDEQSKEYWKWRDNILHNEDLLLEALCFDLQLEQPYKILYDFLCFYRAQDNKQLRNTSWAFLNDSHLTTMCLQYSPRTIAGSALYAGARFADLSFPDDETGRPWWEQLGIDIFEIQQVCNLMADVYENSTLPHQNQKEAYSREDGNASFEKTRSIPTPRSENSPVGSIGAESQGVKWDRNEYICDDSNQNGTHHRQDESDQTRPDLRDIPPSPKRQRRASLTSNGSTQQNGNRTMPSPRGADRRPNSAAEVDDVQQKIDDIINAAGVAEGSHPHPPLPRRPSNAQQPQWPGPPLRRRSSSISNRTRPSSAQAGSQMAVQEYHSPPAKRPRLDRASGQARGSYERENRPPQDHRQDSVSMRSTQDQESRHAEVSDRGEDNGGRVSNYRHTERLQPMSQGMSRAASQSLAEVDDSEKVDYGSEEGEL